MQNVLFINGHLNTGGVERSLVDILRHMDDTKYTVDVLLLEEKGDYLEELPPEEVPPDNRPSPLEAERLPYISYHPCAGECLPVSAPPRRYSNVR